LTLRQLLAKSIKTQCLSSSAIALVVFTLGVLPRAAAAELVKFDVSQASLPTPQPFPQFTARNPEGHEIGANSRFLTLDGRPWLPVMGEFHYSRYPQQDWEKELLKMKAGGVQIVATYIFWIHHEEVEGKFDWSAQRDLRHFVELCQKNGLYVLVRLGPWAHGEVRNGGFPDWLLKKGETRKNDRVYLSYVRKYFAQIGEQLRGLMWKDGGAVIGVQLENEYVLRGPGEGAAHILELKKIAQQSGIVSPLYTVTGWMNPEIPEGEVLPAFAGYPDGFWDANRNEAPPSPDYFFTAIRDDQAVADDLSPKNPAGEATFAKYPYLIAEAGGGMATAYHRRPVVSADDVAAEVLTRLGSGANMFGYYMFHGGTNPDGVLSTLQESQATGYFNDLTVKSYDFQAPLGEFGQMRPSFRRLKLFHLFLQNFGSDLAPMQPVFPDPKPSGLNDRHTIRAAARFASDHGFVFVNNYQRTYPLPDHPDTQISVKLRNETVAFPRNPITIPAGAYFIWPVNFDIGGSLLKYATAEPLLTTKDQGVSYLFFFATPGVSPEFAFDEHAVKSIESRTAAVTHANGVTYVTGINPASEVSFTVISANGTTTQVVVLTEIQAENCWTTKSASGQESVILTPADVYFEGDQLHLLSRTVADLRFSLFPPGGDLLASGDLHHANSEGLFDSYVALVTEEKIGLEKDRNSSPVPMVNVKRVAEPPAEAEFKDAAQWHISLPKDGLAGVSNVFLRIAYAGDIARLYSGDQLLTDDFYKGTVWEIGLDRLSAAQWAGGLRLEIFPLRKDAPIYLPEGAWPKFGPDGQISEVSSVAAEPEYEISVGLGAIRKGNGN
jgi:beta-galactosidase